MIQASVIKWNPTFVRAPNLVAITGRRRGVVSIAMDAMQCHLARVGRVVEDEAWTCAGFDHQEDSDEARIWRQYWGGHDGVSCSLGNIALNTFSIFEY